MLVTFRNPFQIILIVLNNKYFHLLVLKKTNGICISLILWLWFYFPFAFNFLRSKRIYYNVFVRIKSFLFNS